jgi:hypothetical protein
LGLIAFISCSKDENGGSNIVGKWQLIELKINGEIETPDSECEREGWIQFSEGGAYSEYDACTKETNSGTWTLKNNVLTSTSEIIPIPFAQNVVEISDTKLVLKFTLFDTQIATYKKIK